MIPPPRVVVVHDYLTQRGGAERVVLDLLRTFPQARLVTSCWQPGQTFPEFAGHEIETLWVNKIGTLRHDPRIAMPFLARAFESHTVRDADVVICSSSGWAHRVRTAAPKIVYCYNPARWLYQPHDYLQSTPRWLRNQFVASTRGLRASDFRAAHEADSYVVTSTVVAARVRAAYGIEPQIVPPARGLSADGPQEPVAGIEPGFLLTVARSRGYKHTDVACDAMNLLPAERLVVVGGDAGADAAPLNVQRVSRLSDAQLRWLYAHAAGLIAVAHEDFGLTPCEGQAFGVPTVALRRGGYLDTTVEGVTGVFIDEATPMHVADGIVALRSRSWDHDAIRAAGERFSPDTFARRMRGLVEQAVRPVPSMPSVPDLATATG